MTLSVTKPEIIGIVCCLLQTIHCSNIFMFGDFLVNLVFACWQGIFSVPEASVQSTTYLVVPLPAQELRHGNQAKWPEAKILLLLLYQSCDVQYECVWRKVTYVALWGLGGTNERFWRPGLKLVFRAYGLYISTPSVWWNQYSPFLHCLWLEQKNTLHWLPCFLLSIITSALLMGVIRPSPFYCYKVYLYPWGTKDKIHLFTWTTLSTDCIWAMLLFPCALHTTCENSLGIPPGMLPRLAVKCKTHWTSASSF